MLLEEKYRDSDYDIDPDYNTTVSWPDGLNEEYRFLPHNIPKVRRTSSVDDVSRFERYFDLAHSHQGKLFTWKHYLQILRTELLSFNTFTLMCKALLGHQMTSQSEKSTYTTPPETISVKEKATIKKKRTYSARKFIFGRTHSGTSEEECPSTPNSSSSTSQCPRATLKKMCTETRSLARKICKTVEKIATLPPKCTGCGVPLQHLKHKNYCSEIINAFGDTPCSSKPLSLKSEESDVTLSSNTTPRRIPRGTPVRTPTGCGESLLVRYPNAPQSRRRKSVVRA